MVRLVESSNVHRETMDGDETHLRCFEWTEVRGKRRANQLVRACSFPFSRLFSSNDSPQVRGTLVDNESIVVNDAKEEEEEEEEEEKTTDQCHQTMSIEIVDE